MNFFIRFYNVIRGKAHLAMDAIEDPSEQLAVVTDDLNQEIEKQRNAVANAMADEKRIRMEVDLALQQASDWEKRAVLALEHGDENLAREALLKKHDCELRAKAQEPGWKSQKEAVDKLRHSLSKNRDRVEDIKRQFTLSVAKLKTAEAKQNISEAMSHRSSASPQALMDKLHEKIRVMEARSEADLALNGDEASEDLLEKFKSLEKKSVGDRELEELKKRVGENSRAAAS